MHKGTIPGIAILFIALPIALSQSSSSPVDIGLQAYHEYHGGDIDHINLDSGNLTITFPLVSYPQRGPALKMDFGITYNGTGLTYQQVTCVQGKCEYGWMPTDRVYESMAVTQLGIPGSPAMFDTQNIGVTETQLTEVGTSPQAYFDQTIWTTADGATHPSGQTSTGQIAFDGSGIQAGYIEVGGPTPTETCSWDCSLPSIVSSPYLIATQNGITYMESSGGLTGGIARMDADGNYIVQNSSGFADTVGRSIPNPVVYSSPSPSQTASCTGPLTIAEIETWTPPGFTNPFIFCYATVTLTTATQETNGSIVVAHPTRLMLQSIVLPNYQTWTFQYSEALTNCPATNETTNIGDLTEITLPTGGTIQYAYTCVVPWGSTGVTYTTAVTSRTVNANDGTGAHMWTYTYPSVGTTIVTDPLGNQSVYTLNSTSYSSPNRIAQHYTGTATGGTLLRTVTTLYGFATGNGYPLFPTSVTTTLQSGQSTQTAYQLCCNFTFDDPTTGTNTFPTSASYGKVTDTKVYDYATGGTGTLLKEVATPYVFQSNSNYLNPGFFDLIASRTVYNGSGTQVAQTAYGYDQTSRVTSGIASLSGAQMTTPLYSVFGHRTSKTDWLNVGGSSPTTTVSYYDTGEAYQTTDPLGYVTSTYFCTGTPVSVPCSASTYLGALPTAVVNAKSQETTFTYRTDTGQKLTTTDPNGQTATDAYSDTLNRLTSIQDPDGGQTNIQYNDTGNIGVTVTEKITSTVNKQAQAIVDGLGRLSETILLTDPSGPTYTLTTYDALGRKYQVWNPTRCTPTTTPCSGEPTWGITTYTYDALSRPSKVTNPDSTSAQTCYDGVATAGQTNCSTHLGSVATGTWVDSSDERGNHWQRTSNALGQLREVMEPNGASQSPSMESDYGYDALNELLSVTQWGGASGSSGARVRTFTYDSLSRLLCASNPENSTAACPSTATSSYTSGTVGYSFDADGNVHTKTDARSIVTTYAYDALNRLLSKSYSTNSNGSPLACYQYDTSSVSCSLSSNANWIGRLTNAWTQSSATTSSCSTTSSFLTKRSVTCYDPMGRILSEQQLTPASQAGGTTYAPAYKYDLAGNLIYSTDGTTQTSTPGTTLTFTSCADASGRLQAVSSNWSDSTHPQSLFSAQGSGSTPCPNSGSPTASSPTYSPFGGLINAVYGNGLTLSRAYDSRSRITGETDTGSAVNGATSGSATVAITGAEQIQ
jgi:YD repeat-containing protein